MMNNIKTFIKNKFYTLIDIDAKKYKMKYDKTSSKILKFYYLNKFKKIIQKGNSVIPIHLANFENIIFPHEIYGIFISLGTEIGKNCTIFHQVTIGSNTLNNTKKNGAPKIGNNVYIGAGAKIIGDVNVGDNVRIGANCIVVDDIPDNATVVMLKPKVIKNETTRDNRFNKWIN